MAGTANVAAELARIAAWKSANQWYVSGTPAKYGTSGGKFAPALRVCAIERWTPRSLQLEPPEITPSGVTRHMPAPRVRPTNAAAAAATTMAPSAFAGMRGMGGVPRQAAHGMGAARSAAAPKTVSRPYPPARWLIQYTRCVETATEMTMASPTRPARSI